MAWNRPIEGSHVPKKSSRRLWPVIMICCAVAALLFIFLPEDEDSGVSHESNVKRIQRRSRKERKNTPDNYSATGRVDRAVESLGEFVGPTILAKPKSPFAGRTFPEPVKQTFSTGTEQMISWIFTCPVGQMPMPIPPLTPDERKNLAAVLVSKNTISDSDDEMTRYCKETVDFVKKEMIKYLKEGGDPDDFLQHYYQELESAFQYREAARLQGYDLAEEDPQLGREFLNKVNERFREMGISQLSADEFGLPIESENAPNGQDGNHE